MEWSEQLVTLLKYLFLGLVQGFTEPIPVSSSGHVILVQHFLGIEIEGFGFEVLVNFASLLAVLIIYKDDLVKLIRGFLGYIISRRKSDRDDFRFGIYLIIATIPAGVIGLLFEDFIAEQFKGIRVIAITLLITGVALWLIRNLRGLKRDKDLSLKETLIVGFAQAIALIPGISRSGATIVAAMGLGWDRETALRFSFFLYIPVSLGAGILAISDLVNDPHLETLLIPYIVAFIASFIASYFALRWFINVMKSGKLIYFALYCFVVGGILLFVL